jgi:hypothetical protein
MRHTCGEGQKIKIAVHSRPRALLWQPAFVYVRLSVAKQLRVVPVSNVCMCVYYKTYNSVLSIAAVTTVHGALLDLFRLRFSTLDASNYDLGAYT